MTSLSGTCPKLAGLLRLQRAAFSHRVLFEVLHQSTLSQISGLCTHSQQGLRSLQLQQLQARASSGSRWEVQCAPTLRERKRGSIFATS